MLGTLFVLLSVNQETEEHIKNSLPVVRRGVVFAIISMALLMHTIDATIVATALHTLQHELNTTVSWVGWTMTAYSFGFVLMLPLSAKLSTQFGHRRIFTASVLLFTLASLCCGLSENIYMLIAMRTLQAMGGAGITPAATGIIVKHFGSSRAQYLGLFGSIFSIGVIIGPIFGGIFVTYLTWPWIFYINLPLGLLVLIFSWRYVPADKALPARKEQMDFPGLLLMAVAILTAMFAATWLAEQEDVLASPVFLATSLVSVFAFVLMFRHLKRTRDPFIQPRFILGKGFGAVNLYNIVYSGMGIGANALVPLYAVNRYGLSDLNSGTLLVANGIASATLSAIMSVRINKTGYRVPLYVGGSMLAAGLILVALAPPFGLSPFSWLVFSTFFLGLGFGIMSPAGRNAGLQLAPEQSANLAAVRSLGMQIGQIVAVGAFTAIIAASANMGQAQAFAYIGQSVLIMILLVPVVSRIPEIKGSW